MKTTTVTETSSTAKVRRSPKKAIRCSICGHSNVLESRFYFWLRSKEKDVRCRNCGRLLSIGSE